MLVALVAAGAPLPLVLLAGVRTIAEREAADLQSGRCGKAESTPAAPTKLLPAYDSGDHLHPGDVGDKAMGDAIDLALFKRSGT